MTNRFFIKNEFKTRLLLNIEPYGLMYSLPAGQNVQVSDDFSKAPVTLELGIYKGESIITIWPGDGTVLVERNGRDVLEQL